MARINQIEEALRQMEGGKFQTLANQYLHRRYSFSEFSAVGSQAGTDKTTTGVPDAYGIVDGMYTLVGYTTEQDGIEAKLIGDAEDCLNESKTGIPNDHVERIVLCHSKFRLKGNVSNRVKSIDPRIVIIGPEQIAQDLEWRYPVLAYANLGTPLGKGAFISKEAFFRRQRSSAFPTDQSKQLRYRNDELADLVQCISEEKVIILGGPSGCGKTKLALEACDAFAVKCGWDFVVLEAKNSKNADEDIELIVRQSDRLLVMVDDANEQTELGHLLDACVDNEGVKLVLTVRELAKKELERRVKQQARPKMFALEPLSETTMSRILEEDYGVASKGLQSKIATIAHGNIRVAVMAALTYASEEALEGADIYDLYDSYLANALTPYSEKEIEVVETLSIYEYCDLEDTDPCYCDLRNHGMIRCEIHNALSMFNDHEIVSTTTSRNGIFAARIEEQLLRDYFTCRYFFKKRKKALSRFILESLDGGMHTHEKIVRNLEEVFESDEMRDYLRSEIRIAWQEMTRFSKEEKRRFLRCFYHLVPEEALSFVAQAIADAPGVDISESLFDVNTGVDHTLESGILVTCSDIPQLRDRAWSLIVQAVAKGFGGAGLWRSVFGGYGAFGICAVEEDFSFERAKVEGLIQVYEETCSPNIAGALLTLADAMIECRPERPIKNASGQLAFVWPLKPTEGLAQLLTSCVRGLSVLLDGPCGEKARRAFRQLFNAEGYRARLLDARTLAEVIESVQPLVPAFLSSHSISSYRCWKSMQSIREATALTLSPLPLAFPDALRKAAELKDVQDRFAVEVEIIDLSAWAQNDIRDVLAFLLEDARNGEDGYLSEMAMASVLTSLAEQLPIEEAHNLIEQWLDDAAGYEWYWFPYEVSKNLAERTSPEEEIRWADALRATAGKWLLVSHLEGIAIAASPSDYVLDVVLLHVREGGRPQAIETICGANAFRPGYAAMYAKAVSQSPDLSSSTVRYFLGKCETEHQREAYAVSFSEQPDILKSLYLHGMVDPYFDYDYSILLYLCELDNSFINDYLDFALNDGEYSLMVDECRRISRLWMSDNLIAEQILAMAIDKVCMHPLRAPLFQHLVPVREATSSRKELFWDRIAQYIDENISDRKKMEGLSIAFADADDEIRERFILTLLTADEEGVLVGHVWVERSSMSGDQANGFIIAKRKEADVLRNVKRALPYTENYNKHRAWLDCVITQKEQSIADEKWELFHSRW